MGFSIVGLAVLLSNKIPLYEVSRSLTVPQPLSIRARSRGRVEVALALALLAQCAPVASAMNDTDIGVRVEIFLLAQISCIDI